jgi:hypothetical protein
MRRPSGGPNRRSSLSSSARYARARPPAPLRSGRPLCAPDSSAHAPRSPPRAVPQLKRRYRHHRHATTTPERRQQPAVAATPASACASGAARAHKSAAPQPRRRVGRLLLLRLLLAKEQAASVSGQPTIPARGAPPSLVERSVRLMAGASIRQTIETRLLLRARERHYCPLCHVLNSEEHHRWRRWSRVVGAHRTVHTLDQRQRDARAGTRNETRKSYSVLYPIPRTVNRSVRYTRYVLQPVSVPTFVRATSVEYI